MREVSTTVPASVPGIGGKNAHFAIFDSVADMGRWTKDNHAQNPHGSFKWCGDHTFDDAVRCSQTGDLSRVAASEALLSQMEKYELPTPRNRWVDDVCGPLPNVPAFVAGHPLNMRRRVKSQDDSAPIAIVADLTIKAICTPEQIARRGAAILALVRALSMRRPIELWVISGLNKGRGAGYAMSRVETTPLDLATAAYALTHASTPRWLTYGVVTKQFGCGGNSPFCCVLTRSQMEAVFAPVLPHVAQTICLPELHADDPCINRPEQWIAQQLAEHGAVSLADAA